MEIFSFNLKWTYYKVGHSRYIDLFLNSKENNLHAIQYEALIVSVKLNIVQCLFGVTFHDAYNRYIKKDYFLPFMSHLLHKINI